MCILNAENNGIIEFVPLASWSWREISPENYLRCDKFYAVFVRIANLKRIVFVDFYKNEKNTPKTVDKYENMCIMLNKCDRNCVHRIGGASQ